jgi:GrpB-like predicted nucleotidyltransferase (UPF0157 family)
MERLHFAFSETFQPVAIAIVEQVGVLVRSVVPHADVQDMGGTAVPGLLTKGDVDVSVRVTSESFAAACEVLRNSFVVHQPENWTDGYASFADESSYPLPVGVQVTIMGHSDDRFLQQRDRLLDDPALVAKYNDLKRAYEGSTQDEYRPAKWAFIEKYLS